jgi:hypothetical protein
MEAATEIRNAVASVSLLRDAVHASPALGLALAGVKRLQSRRFAGTYADLLAAPPYAAATRFFLDELYSDKDYTERDAQFARIAGAIQRLFPAQVAATAVTLAQLHALTEELDQAMAGAWAAQGDPSLGDAHTYMTSWRRVGRRADRERQLEVVIDVGRQMARLTRTPGLRTMLKMMRAPAVASGLGSLQRFLETGFETFAEVVRRRSVDEFLAIVQARESALIALLFDADLVACEAGLRRTLGEVPPPATGR